MITKINLGQSQVEAVGVKPGELRDLGNVVVLAGPNGSGKSRYLRLVHDIATSASRTPRESLAALKIQSDMMKSHAPTGGAPSHYEKALEEGTLLHDSISMSSEKPATVWLDPGHVVVRAPRLNVDLPGNTRTLLPEIANGRQSRLQHHATAIFNARHPDLAADPEVQALGRTAQGLNELLEAAIGTSLTVGISGTEPKPKLFDRFYAEGELSAGQHLLLVWALLLHENRKSLPPGSIAFVDEPERQLHPKAAIELLQRLRDAVGPEGQLWIATHSPSVVAAFGHQSLYRVERNAISYAGTRADDVLDGLLGGAEGRRALADHLAEADQLNLFRYAIETLLPAAVAGHAAGDRQETQFARVVEQSLKNTNTLKILDYAAGKGRLAVALADGLPNALRARVQYFAYNDPKHNSDANECLRNVAVFHTVEAEHHASTEISDFFGDGRVNIVVMANFLHELEPHSWGDHFALAAKALRDDGILIIMEDQEPPVGELPTENGFIVLDLAALRILFGHDKEVRPLVGGSRLTAYEVPRKALLAYDGGYLREALEETLRRAKTELRNLRKANVTSSPQARGRRHAFLTSLFTTAQLTLDEMPKAQQRPRA